VAVACAAPGPQGQREREAAPAARPPQSVLQIGMLLENQPVGAMTTYGRGTGLGGREHFFVFHGNLTMFDPNSEQLPSIASKVPSLSDGDWKLLPSGGMEVTFTIRPNVLWHDGTALSAEDFVFGFQVATDPSVTAAAAQLRPIADVRAPDSQTVTIAWKELSPFGYVNSNEGVPALPRHLLQDLYLSHDQTAFDNSPYWKADWVGLGPYRLTRWEFGSFMEGRAFDDFFLGRPKIDRIRINYVGDANTLIANLLAGTVDVVPSGAGLDVGDQVVVRDKWRESGTEGLFLPSLKGVQALSFQFRYPTPWAQDVRVRQALISFLNRDLLAETQTERAVPKADFLLLDRDPIYKQAVARGFPTYPHDAARGERLMAEAGWARTGSSYRNGAGEEFPRFDVAGNQGSDNVRRQAAVADLWTSAGIPSDPKPFTALRGLELAEETHSYPAIVFRNWILGFLALNRVAAAEIGTPENRWMGNNYGGWLNPAYQDLLGRFNRTLEAPARLEQATQLVKILAEEVPVIPLWFSGNPAIVRPGVAGPGEISPEVPATMWNIYAWDYR